MRVAHPEQCIRKAQAFQAHIGEHAAQNENQEKQKGCHQSAHNDQHGAIKQQKARTGLPLKGSGGKELVNHGWAL
jgi:hypothetical protein